MKKSIFTLMTLSSLAVGAQTIELNQTSDWKEPSGIFRNDVLVYGKNWRIVSTHPLLKVDPTAQYVLELEMKGTGKNMGKSILMAGFSVYDANKKEINPAEVLYIRNTETELTEAVTAGDTVLKLKNTLTWRKNPYLSIAFNVKNDFKDLPNREIMNNDVKSFLEKGTHTELILKNPIQKSYPAGTRVRQHLNSSYMFMIITPVTDAWTKKTAMLSGVSDGKNPIHSGKWWPGTIYFRPYISISPVPAEPVEIRNIRLKVKRQSDIF